MTDTRLSRAQLAKAAVIGTAAYVAVAALGRTFRWQVDGYEHFERLGREGNPVIFAFWHGRILPATCFWRDRQIVVMTSQNFDGEWIARIIRKFGYEAARGSTSSGGGRALVQMRRELQAGRPAAFTLDGPRGPARVAQPGAVWLASRTGSPILPFLIEASRFWTLQSWDRTQVPIPYSRVAVAIGEPLRVPREVTKTGLDRCRDNLALTLSQLAERTEEMLGAPEP